MKPEPALARKEDNVLNTVRVLTILNLMLAVVVLLKDMLMAAYLGTSGEADALLLAYSMNDIPGNNLFASAIGISCIPVFSALYIKDENKEFKKVIAGISTVVVFASASVMILLYVFKDMLIAMMGRGFTGSISFMCISLFAIILPTILMYPVSAIGTSVLQVSGRFIIPAAAPVVFNTIKGIIKRGGV